MTSQLSHRLLSTERVIGLDIARWLALVLMMATHLIAIDDHPVPTWRLILSGRPSALFCVLAGFSLVLGAPRHEGTIASWSWRPALVRAGLIAAVGFTIGTLNANVTPILVTYGVLFALGAVMMYWSWQMAFATAGLLAVAAPVGSFAIRSFLPEPSYSVLGWAAWADPVALVWEVLFTGYFPVVVWVVYLLVGIASAHAFLRYGAKKVARVLVSVGSVLAIASWVTGVVVVHALGDRLIATSWPFAGRDATTLASEGFYGTSPIDSRWWLLTAPPHSGTLLDLTGTAGSAVATIGFMILLTLAYDRFITRVPIIRWIGLTVAAAGSATLTMYFGHAVLNSIGRDSGLTLLLQWPFQVALTLTGGAIIALLGRRGPLEAAVTSLARSAHPQRSI